MTRFEVGRIHGRWQCQAWVQRPSYDDPGVYVWINIDSGVTVEGEQHPEPDPVRPKHRVAGAVGRHWEHRASRESLNNLNGRLVRQTARSVRSCDLAVGLVQHRYRRH